VSFSRRLITCDVALAMFALVSLSLLSVPSEATTIVIDAQSISASYSGSISGYVNGTYYDDGGYGLSPSSCLAQFQSNCVFGTLPATASVSGVQTYAITNQPMNGAPLTETVTSTFSASTSALGSTKVTSQFSFGTSPGAYFIPAPGDVNISFPSSTSPNLFGSAGAFSSNPSFVPIIGTTGTVDLVSGNIALQQPQAPSLHVVNTLLTGSLGGGSVAYDTLGTPPPTVQTLAALSNDGYASVPSTINGYAPSTTIEGVNGFQATVYKNVDQIVIATRGTFTSELTAGAYNILADASYTTGVPDPSFISSVDQLAALVEQVANNNPTAQITLTGHSLGGGIAQVVGKLANIQTVTFDAPGSAEFIPYFTPLLPALESTPILSPTNQIVDYRLFGDQISFTGTQVGSSVTVDYPSNLGGNAAVLANPLNFLQYHHPDILVSQLNSEPAEYAGFGPGPIELAGAPGPNITQQIIFGTKLAGGATLNFVAAVSAAVQALLDPGPGYAYFLQEDSNSPFFESLALPVFGSIAGWDVVYFTDSGGLGFEFSPTGQFSFGLGVDALRFDPVDSLGHDILNPDPFVLGLTFYGDGTFNGTLSTDLTPPGGTPASVPEPSTLAVVVVGLLGLGLLRRPTGRQLDSRS
jgi:lipase (class 3)